MSKRILALGLVFCMTMIALTGCGSIKDAVIEKIVEDYVEENGDIVEEDDVEEDIEEDVEVEEPEEDIEEDVEDDIKDEIKEEAKDEPQDEGASNDAGVEERPAATSNAELGDNYVDLDNLSFAVNGKVYTVGQTTLQEMIDDGVPFDEDDIANAGNNINGNSESQGFGIILGEYYSAQVYVGNYTDDNKTIAECPISEIYLPVHTDEPQDILEFAFPLTLTEEELLANAGEPTELDEWEDDDSDYYINTYDYTRESTVYYGDWGYSFEFMKGEFDYVTINWMP